MSFATLACAQVRSLAVVIAADGMHTVGDAITSRAGRCHTRTGAGQEVYVNSSEQERFEAVYAHAYDDVLRFVQRRMYASDVGLAEDVVADAMLVAWRRVGELPVELGDARAWLFGIARNCLLNSARSLRRHDALGVRVAQASGSGTTPDAADAVATQVDLSAAWEKLSPGDQEVVGLAVFEGLTSAQAAAVVGTTSGAFRIRLSRARAALRRHLEGAAQRLHETAPYEGTRS